MTAPTVTIVVPCYNGGRFLDTLMASLTKQEFRDFDVIVVNDGSTEPETIQKLDSLRSQVQVIDQKNKHLPGARNTGFREARGEFVLPLDCDDELEPAYLSRTVAALRAATPDIGFAFTHMRLTGAIEGFLHNPLVRFDQLFLNRLPYCMLIRKSAWEKIGGYDESMRDGMEDWEFNLHLTEAGFRGLEISAPLFVYNVRADGMLLSKTARMQSTIWRYVRTKHDALYRLSSMISLWRESERPLHSLALATGFVAIARFLPETWANALIFRLIMLARSWRTAGGQIRAIP